MELVGIGSCRLADGVLRKETRSFGVKIVEFFVSRWLVGTDHEEVVNGKLPYDIFIQF